MNKIERESRRAGRPMGVHSGMMRLKNSFLLLGMMLCGCAQYHATTTPDPVAMKPSEARKLETRNNAVSLLYDLFQDEKNVNKVLLIKRNSEELGDLIDAVAHTSGDSAKRLEVLAKADPMLKLHALELPAGEKATRDSIAKTKEHELLFSSGGNFQFQLLLTQTDALSYGWHLAKIAAENSSQPEEVRIFTGISKAYEDLYGRVITMLRTEARKTP
jgi:hypothetical protein